MTVRTQSGAVRRAAAQRWPWLVPVALAAFVYGTNGTYVSRALAALAAVVVVALATRRPDRSLLLLVAGLPFQGLFLAQLYRWGVPGAVVRPLGSWKEALGLGVVLAGIRGYRQGRQRLDVLDGLGFAYVAIVGAYALAPHFFAPGAPIDSSARSLAFRASAGFVILLLGARHAPLPADFANRLARVVMIVGCVVAAVCVYEYFFSASWNRWVVEKVQYLRYQVNILHNAQQNGDVRRYSEIGGHRVLRTGSVFLDPTSCGFFLVLPFAIAVERRLRTAARGAIPAIILIATGLMLTETRAALLGGLVVALLAMRPAAGRTLDRRLQFTFVFLAGLAIALPAATAIGLGQRVTATSTSRDPSSVDHMHSFWTGFDAIKAKPVGHGLATSAGTGQRFDNGQATIGENSYLQVGIETGVGAMAVFVALTFSTLGRLRRLSRRTTHLAISAAFGAGVGLAIGAFFLQAWNDFAVAWTFWALAGTAIGVAERSRARSDVPVPLGVPGVSGVRVGFDVSALLSGDTGVARYVRELGAAIERADVDLVRFAIGRGGRRDDLPRATRRIPVPLRIIQRSWALAGSPCAERLAPGCEVVHTPDLVPPPSRRPLVLTVHDLVALEHPDLHPARSHVVQRRQLAAAAVRATVVIAVSQATADALTARGVDRDRIVVAPNGVTALPRPRPELAPPGPFLLAVGSLTPRKGLDTLLAAFASAELPGDLRLVLAGPPGFLAETVTDAIARHDLADRVDVVGRVSDEQLSALYAACTAVCVPSIAEGFGLPILEAAAAGAPVIASDIAVFREVAGNAPWFARVRDVRDWAGALERVVGDKELRDELRERGFEVAREYTWDRAAAVTCAAYERALDAA